MRGMHVFVKHNAYMRLQIFNDVFANSAYFGKACKAIGLEVKW